MSRMERVAGRARRRAAHVLAEPERCPWPGAGALVACLAVAACGGEAPSRGAGADAGSAPAERALWQEGPRLPAPVAGNAVAALRGPAGLTVVSALGTDATGADGGATSAAYRWDVDGDAGWREVPSVPGPGRVGATAQGLAGRVFVFGGRTVAEDGTERTLADVAVYDVGTGNWGWAADIPVPVADAVSGVWARSLIYLVGGRHRGAGVADVQLFDPSIDRWMSATPVSGPPVFGHAGGVVGDDIVYVGGVGAGPAGGPPLVVDGGAWHGRIDVTDPARIDWRPVTSPPGPAVHGAAGGAAGGLVLFAGGTDAPHGLAGGGAAAVPVHRLLGYDPRAGWVELPPPPVATMDHRSLAFAGGRVFLVGGATEGRRPSDRVWYADVEALLAAARGG